MKTIITIILLAMSLNAYSSKEDNGECENKRCVNDDTRAFWGITFTPSFKNTYEIGLINTTEGCDDDVTPTMLPKKSYFKQTLVKSSQNEKEMIVHIYEVDEFDDRDNSTPNKKTTEDKYFSKPFKLCLVGDNKVGTSYYKRVGGVNTGILVVPFKLRSGDIFSDSTIGQYISYKWEVIELLATAGLSQLSISEIGTNEIETKTGITYAFGINFEIDKDWDLALLIGADHLSGTTGDNWQYQNKAWVSFAIGFNFTR